MVEDMIVVGAMTAYDMVLYDISKRPLCRICREACKAFAGKPLMSNL